jgi:hypothetical protein
VLKRSRSSWQIRDAAAFERLPRPASAPSASMSRIDRSRTNAPITIARNGPCARPWCCTETAWRQTARPLDGPAECRPPARPRACAPCAGETRCAGPTPPPGARAHTPVGAHSEHDPATHQTRAQLARWTISRAPSRPSSDNDSRGFSPTPTLSMCSIRASICADGGTVRLTGRSGRRRAHPGAPHTTGRAGPHPAVRLASRKRW